MVRFFPLKSIQSYVEVFVSKSEQLMSIVETKVGAGVVNVHELIKYYSLDNISSENNRIQLFRISKI